MPRGGLLEARDRVRRQKTGHESQQVPDGKRVCVRRHSQAAVSRSLRLTDFRNGGWQRFLQ